MMKRKMVAFFLAFALFATCGSVVASANSLSQDDTVTAHTKGNDNFTPPEVLPPQT